MLHIVISYAIACIHHSCSFFSSTWRSERHVLRAGQLGKELQALRAALRLGDALEDRRRGQAPATCPHGTASPSPRHVSQTLKPCCHALFLHLRLISGLR